MSCLNFLILYFFFLDALQEWCTDNGGGWTGTTCLIRKSAGSFTWDAGFDKCNSLYQIEYPIPGGSTQFKGRLAQPRTNAVWSIISGYACIMLHVVPRTHKQACDCDIFSMSWALKDSSDS